MYGADGNRLISRASDKTTLYLPDGTELELTAGGGPVLGTRHYGSTAVRDATGLRWVAGDRNGTSIVQIDAVTLDCHKRRKMPYGEDRGAQPAAWMGTKGYVGGTRDETGLTHLGAREYDPTLGRFISVDPIMDLTDPQQWHAYTYSHNSPVTFSDPSGLYDEETSEGGGQRSYSYNDSSGKRKRRYSGKAKKPAPSSLCLGNQRSASCAPDGRSGGHPQVEVNGINFEGVAPDAFTVMPCWSIKCFVGTYSIVDGEQVGTYEARLLGLCYQSGKCTTELVAYLIMTCGCYAAQGVTPEAAGWAGATRQAIAALVPVFYDPLPGGVYVVLSTADVVISLPNGEQYTIPSDWKARLADNGRGMVWQKASAIGGQYKDAHSIRIMEPKPGYPNGYVVVYNAYGQPIGLNGKPTGKAGWHFPRGPRMPYPKVIP